MEPEQRPAERGRSQTEWGHYAPAIERWERTIDRPAPAPTDDGKLSSRFVEWMMGLPDGHVCALGMARTAELKMLGNGVVPPQAALALRLLDER
jgi:DNA (cytosine-5)-methyltransferase 1